MKKISLKQYIFSFCIILFLSLIAQSILNPLFVFQELNYLFQPYDLRGFAKGIIYCSVYLLSVIGIVVLLGVRSAAVFAIIMLLFFIFYAVDFFIQFIGETRGFSLDKFTLAMHEAGHYEFLVSYIDYIIYALLLSLLFISILLIIRKVLYKTKYSSLYLLFIIIPTAGVYFASTKISSVTLSSFPSVTKFPAIILWYRIQPKTAFIERVLDENITTTREASYENIIWIIDESITGTYLSINGYDKKTTPYLASLLKTSEDITNYGIVNSVSNCSSPSNFYLRLGLNPRGNFDFMQAKLTLPTIYHYAKRAGYTTWLYDSQTSKDTLQNGMSIYDIKQVDHFITLDRDIEQNKRDKIFLDDMEMILRQRPTEKKFIVMVKFGAHFPYLLSYDTEYTFFEPAMDTTYGGMTMENKPKLINTYLNAIRNNTDRYLEEMLSKIDLTDTAIFYTSDHGQNILENDNRIVHCNKTNIVKNEVTVPLILFAKDAKKIFPVVEGKSYSQIQIFPTTLSLMGYTDTVIKKYGKTLWEGLSQIEKRKYFILYQGEIGIYDE